ncbi:DUF302 domain-containing protein [Salinicoccus roseus]|uniref:DUF302 domain-containing protein n=1 Tax=Salinicoccus roseus TaxID=45670 RepID=UPI002FE08F8B
MLEFDQPYRVLEVCNPQEGKKVLEENQMVGYFLPCKMVVYEGAGTTKIGLPKPTALIEMVKDDSLKQFAQDMEDRLITCMDRAV